MKNIKKSFLMSSISLLLCFIMLLGTTFAWFTDSVTSSGNKIQAGTLKLDLEMLNKETGAYESIKTSNDPIFNYNLWEPGYTDVKFLKVENEGSLSLQWKAMFVSDEAVSKLAEVIDVYVLPSVTELGYDNLTRDFDGWRRVGTLDQFINTLSETTYGNLLPYSCAYLGIALHMQEEAGNEYQEIGLEALDIQIVATQMSNEEDSFGPDYDNDAEWPATGMNFSATQSLAGVNIIYGELAQDVIIRHKSGAYAIVPAGTKLAEGVTELKLSGKGVENAGNFDDETKSYDIHIEGIAYDNTKCIKVFIGAILDKNLGETELKLYHEDVQMTRVDSVEDFAINNQFTYDPTTGAVVLYVDNFSIFSGVKTSADVWDGEASDKSWYSDANTEFTLTTAAQFVGFRDLVDAGNTFAGKTVKLGADIDLNNIPFDPIGYNYESKGGQVFKGTFDGANHTIYNLYQNCWELDPDKTNYSTYTYSTAGAGLFASIKDATIKNLAVSGAEIVFECVDMGIIVGYAQGTCHFENIVVSHSKIANYNRYTGGVVGEVSGGPYGTDTTKGYSHTFKNIVVDSTVTVSGLWGSFGCGMGGVIGGKWGDATVLMENVISAPVMDVYNDVVSAYQWYAFRGCGMLIGHTEEPYSDGRTAGIARAGFLTCENVKVYYGDWVNYTYYQFANQTDAEDNPLWYSDYPWVRAEKGEYCEAFSNIRYGIPLIKGVKVTELGEEAFNAAVTSTTKIIFDQLYGADRGMYGQAKHEGVTVIYDLGETKTVYIYNNQNWQNLSLHYWYRNGEDTWTNISEDGVSMDNMELPNFTNVYRLRLPAYVDGLKITADDGQEIEFNLVDLENDGVYTLDGNSHEHTYTDGKCDCGAYETSKWKLVTDVKDLAVGDKIVIVAADYGYGMSAQADHNRRGYAIVKNSDGTITINENIQILTLAEGTIEGTFGLYTGSGYLYAAASDSNYLKTQATNNVNGEWTIKITNGIASIIAESSKYRNVMQYNPNNGSPLFACYSSASQKAIAIYKLTSSDSEITPHNCLEFAVGATCEGNATCTMCAQEIPDTALGHDYESEVTEATCTNNGYITYTCTICDHSYEETTTEPIGHNDVNGVCTNCGATLVAKWTLVTNIANLNVGDQIVIVAKNYSYAISTTQNSNNRGQAGVTKNGNTIEINTNVQILTLEEGTKSGTWAFYTGSGYLYAASSSKNYLRTQTTNNDNGSWQIDIADNGTATIKAQGTNTNNWLRYNSTNTPPLFSCYDSGQTDVVIYKLVSGSGSDNEGGETPECTHENTTTNTVDATCVKAGSITVTCDDCGETISTETIEATGEHTYKDGVCAGCGKEEETTGVETTTISFGSTEHRLSQTNSQQVWKNGDVTFTNDKASSTSNVANYSNPVRLYKSSKVTVEATGIKTIVFDCNSSAYATALKNSIGTVSGATVTVSSDKVTVTFDSAVDSFAIAKLSEQVRLDSITVNP